MLPLANPQKNDEGLATLRRARPPQVFLQGRVDSMSDFKNFWRLASALSSDYSWHIDVDDTSGVLVCKDDALQVLLSLIFV